MAAVSQTTYEQTLCSLFYHISVENKILKKTRYEQKLLMCLLQLFLIKTIRLIDIKPYFDMYLSHSVFNFLLLYILSVLLTERENK